jgi:hypothetical protein
MSNALFGPKAVFLGQFATDAAAIAYVVAQGWDNPPGQPQDGYFYFDTTLNVFKGWDSTSGGFVVLGGTPTCVCREVLTPDYSVLGQVGIGNNGFAFATISYNFSDGVTDTIVYKPVYVHPMWGGGNIVVKVRWRTIGGGAGDVRWELRYSAFKPGESTGASPGSPLLVTSTANGFNIVEAVFNVPAADLGLNDEVHFRLARLGADGADTLADEAGVTMVLAEV